MIFSFYTRDDVNKIVIRYSFEVFFLLPLFTNIGLSQYKMTRANTRWRKKTQCFSIWNASTPVKYRRNPVSVFRVMYLLFRVRFYPVARFCTVGFNVNNQSSVPTFPVENLAHHADSARFHTFFSDEILYDKCGVTFFWLIFI